jgi:hypothetical protein
MDSAELLARTERFALDSLGFFRKLPKAPEAQVCLREVSRVQIKDLKSEI